MNLPDNYGIALLMTLLAGLATMIGGAVAFVVKKPKEADLVVYSKEDVIVG